MRKLSPIVLAVAVTAGAVVALVSGCELYIESDDCRYGDRCGGGGNPTPPGPGPTPWVDGGSFTCTSDEQCAAGCYCDDGYCAEAGFCQTDNDCGPGYHCDEPRASCVPDDRDASCGGPVMCADAPPSCPVGHVPAIAGGCYTGDCVAIADCDAPPLCEALKHEADCLARVNSGCGAIYTGINCTKPDGTACQSSDTGCTCESFSFHSCTIVGP